MEGLKGRKAVVTGAANGIGASIVEELSLAGVEVFFCDVDTVAGAELAQRTGAHFSELDVRNTEALLKWFRSCNGVDIVVNNVGVSEFKPLTEIGLEEFDRVIATNLRPVFVLSREFALLNRGTRYGRIVNIASTRHIQSEPSSEAYAAAKGGVVSLTHALAVSLSEYENTTVNSISPGWIDTSHYDISAEDHALHPSARVGECGDISRLVKFLCDPANGFVNGQDFVVDGGMTKKMIY